MVVRKKRNSLSKDEENVQLYRPRGPFHAAQELLERKDLTDQDIVDFCNDEKALRPASLDAQELEYLSRVEAYRDRRKEIQELKRKLRIGEARIDDDGNLVPVTNPPLPPAALLPAPPPPRPNFNMGANPPAADNDEVDQQWMEQEEREAAAAIARAVQRYREQGVADDDLRLIRVRPEDGERTNFTFRRICCAVLAVVTAFICILLQTLPLMRSSSVPNPVFDKLMSELLHVKNMGQHSLECPGLHRESNITWVDRLRELTGYMSSTSTDCSDGVLHIPAPSVYIDQFVKSKSVEEISMLKPFVTNGVNLSWFLTCQVPPEVQSSCYPGAPDNMDSGVCSAPSGNLCFRGVHDDFVMEHEVGYALGMGSQLIKKGGDHFDIHYDTIYLKQWIPHVVTRLKFLLRDTYHVNESLQPVAFRVSAAAPIDGEGVPIYSANNLIPILNRTNYINWFAKSSQRNELADNSLPWPFRTEPARDTCNLMADMEADPRFAVHTTVFLADGAGDHYRGGASLYVDHHPSNSNPRRKIRRGVTIDGSMGRVVVSTGGLENRRCRLPTRAGVRAALQIWWGC
jgi:hypothetical protein